MTDRGARSRARVPYENRFVCKTFALYVIPLILSLSVHECAHAWAAKRLGDDTAEKLGRLTLNPLSHIDPIGTLILPMMLIYTMGAPYFAWAKPVPYESSRFRRDITRAQVAQ